MSELSIVVDRLKLSATPDQAEQIDRVIARYVSDSHYSAARAAAHLGAVFGEILDVSTWDAVAVWASRRSLVKVSTDRASAERIEADKVRWLAEYDELTKRARSGEGGLADAVERAYTASMVLIFAVDLLRGHEPSVGTFDWLHEAAEENKGRTP